MDPGRNLGSANPVPPYHAAHLQVLLQAASTAAAAEHGALNNIVSNADAVPGQNQNTYRSQRPIPRLIMRTLFFDDLVTLALQQQQQQPGHDAQQLADRLLCISTCTHDAASSVPMLQAHTRNSACSSTVHGPDAQLHYLHQLLMPQPKELQPVGKSISTVNMNGWMLDAPCTQVRSRAACG